MSFDEQWEARLRQLIMEDGYLDPEPLIAALVDVLTKVGVSEGDTYREFAAFRPFWIEESTWELMVACVLMGFYFDW